ncbi:MULTISPECIES: PAS domain-containing protein, partial [unclassified Methanosarcina]|uniref:PAS domain-containing protein n=1 Tax=unclassified Methanosarcina TaxID=2644672 RepID=UPI0006220DB3
MISNVSDIESQKQKDSSKKLIEDVDLKSKEISWLIDNLPITVFRVANDSSWSMDYISKDVEKLTGYSNMDFINQKLLWTDIVFPEDIQKHNTVLQKAVKNKTSLQVEYRIKKSDGSTVYIQEQATPVIDDKGKLIYLEGVFLDVTQQVIRQEDSRRVIVKSIPKPSFAYFVDSSRKINCISDYFVEVCHLKSENDLVGMSPSEIIESSTLIQGTNGTNSTSKTKSLAEKVLETGEAVYDLEGSVKLRGAEKALLVICSAVPIKDEAGIIVGSLTVLTDMTEMKEKEKEVKDLLDYTNICLKDLGEGIRGVSEGDLDAHL